MWVRGGKLEIRKKLRRKSARKNGARVRTTLGSGNWGLAAGRRRKERVKRRDEEELRRRWSFE
jgi:hypothetical protein